jgi:hypothetical protein
MCVCSLKVYSHTYQCRISSVSVPYHNRSVRIREKYVTEPDISERVHHNVWQRYFLALTLMELSGHVTDKCEWTSTGRRSVSGNP